MKGASRPGRASPYDLVFGLTQVGIGLSFLLFPEVYSFIRPVTIATGILLLLAGVSSLLWGSPYTRLPAGLGFLILALEFFSLGEWRDVALYGILALQRQPWWRGYAKSSSTYLRRFPPGRKWRSASRPEWPPSPRTPETKGNSCFWPTRPSTRPKEKAKTVPASPLPGPRTGCDNGIFHGMMGPSLKATLRKPLPTRDKERFPRPQGGKKENPSPRGII